MLAPAYAEPGLAADRIPVQSGHLPTRCTAAKPQHRLLTKCRPKGRLPGVDREVHALTSGEAGDNAASTVARGSSGNGRPPAIAARDAAGMRNISAIGKVPFVHSNYERRKDDHYTTIDGRCVQALVETWPLQGVIVECCAPRGSEIVDWLNGNGHEAMCAGAVDFNGPANWIVTNPPYQRPLVDQIAAAVVQRVSGRRRAGGGATGSLRLGPSGLPQGAVRQPALPRCDPHALPSAVERGTQGQPHTHLRAGTSGPASQAPWSRCTGRPETQRGGPQASPARAPGSSSSWP